MNTEEMTAELFKWYFPHPTPPPLLRINNSSFILFQITQALILVSVLLNRGIIHFCSIIQNIKTPLKKILHVCRASQVALIVKNSPDRFICRCIY